MTTYIKTSDGGGFFDENGGSQDIQKDVDGNTPDQLSHLPMKKLLYAMQVKGAKVCEDLQIMNNGEIYLKDGTGMSSLVKDVEFLTREVSLGQFEARDADGELLEGTLTGNETDGYQLDGEDLPEGAVVEELMETKHFMKIYRPDGQVEEKPVAGMDEMLNGMDADGLVESLPELVKAVNDLKAATLDVIGADGTNPVAREHDVDHLEDAFDKFVVDFRSALIDMEQALRDQATLRDEQIMNDSKDRLNEIVLAMNNTMDRDYGVQSIGFDTFAALNGAGQVSVVKALSGNASNSDAGRYDIGNWIIETSVRDESNSAAHKVRNSSVWHTAKIEDDKIKVTVRLVDCADLTAERKVQVAVAYCGPLGDIDAASDPADRTPRVYNEGSGDLAPTLVVPTPDSDSNHNTVDRHTAYDENNAAVASELAGTLQRDSESAPWEVDLGDGNGFVPLPEGYTVAVSSQEDGPTPAKISKGTYSAPTP